MLLLSEDVERLMKLGFHPSYFVLEKDGWLELRNRGGRCVFNHSKKCIVYEDRPDGCRSYPVAQGREGAVLDGDCQHGEEFRITKAGRQRLTALVAKLKAERSKRMLK
jgi:hypothetical protein